MASNYTDNAFGVYLHIPFCRHKCPYCDFNSYPICQAPIDQKLYIEALCTEIRSAAGHSRWQHRKLRSIYLGGGTPSTLAPDLLVNIFLNLRNCFNISKDTEITIEANPESIVDSSGPLFLQRCLELGINRVSLGIQSFQDQKLKWLGRPHNSKDCIDAINLVRANGLENICIDLMFGTPDDNTQSWEIDLKLALEHKPVHISAYCLSLSEGCRFFSDYQTGLIRLPNEEQQRVLFSLASSVLTDAGYEHYEISNYAKENKRSRHNQAYWQGIDYLGLGAGAHSYLGRKARQLNQRVQNYGIRWSNKSNPKEYVHSVRQLRSKYEMIERINQAQAKTEFMMLRLRQADGFGVKEYESEFQSKLPKKVVSSIENFCRQGLAKTEKSRISLTPQGFLLADEIVRELVAELD